MGDADSMIDARAIAMLEAKRMASEYAGTLIESETVVEDYEVTTDEVRTYAAAFMKVETLSEKRSQTKSGSMKLILEIRAEIDKTSLIERIGKMVNNPKERDNVNLIHEEKLLIQMRMGKLSREIRDADTKGDHKNIEQLIAQRKELLGSLEKNFDAISHNISELSKQSQRNHQEQKKLLQENNNELAEIKQATKQGNELQKLTNKAVFWNQNTLSNALVIGDIETLDIFRTAGKDLTLVKQPVMNMSIHSSILINAIYNNHANINEVLDYLVKYKAIDLNDFFQESVVSTGVQNMWQDYIKDNTHTKNKKRKKEENEHKKLEAIWEKETAEYEQKVKTLKLTYQKAVNSWEKANTEYSRKMQDVQDLVSEQYVNGAKGKDGKTLTYNQLLRQITKSQGVVSPKAPELKSYTPESQGIVRPKQPVRQFANISSTISPVQTAKITLFLASIWADNKQAKKYLISKGADTRKNSLITLADGTELKVNQPTR